jgi:exopolysaccharide biosynthesis WecB/TagA/CpsF family protein
MIDYGKKNIGGVLIDAVDYDAAVSRVVHAAILGRGYSVSALAVHGVMTGAEDSEHRFRLNGMDLVVPDGQPVRWALNLLHGCKLKDRVYGPNLTLRLLQAAADNGLPVYFYGTTGEVLEKLRKQLRLRYPTLQVSGMESSRFRRLVQPEREALVQRVRDSGAKMLFVGLGCPRQEVFAFEMAGLVSIPTIAVGAAFPFIAGTLQQAPAWMQRYGLEWVFRFTREPKRLWHRYIVLNPKYLARIALQWLGRTYSKQGEPPRRELLFG